MTPEALAGGFVNAPVQSAHAFRAALEALARPGEIRDIAGATPPAPLSVAAGTLLLMLCDATTPVHLAGAHDNAMTRDWITFHTNAPLVSAEEASFAVGTWEAFAPINRFAVGLPDYPDRSATLIIEMPLLVAQGARLTGPGIQTATALNLPESATFRRNRDLFPLGLDFFLTSGTRLAALPRSTRVEDL